MYSYQTCQVIGNSIEGEHSINSVVREIKPHWKENDITTEVLCETATKRIFVCYNSCDPNKQDALLFKCSKFEAQGSFFDKDIDREFCHWNKLNENKVGVPLIARLQNGLVQQYVPGKILDMEMTKDVAIARLVAEEIAKFHEVLSGDNLYTDKFCDGGELNHFDTMCRISIMKLNQYSTDDSYSDILSQFMSAGKMEKEFRYLKQHLSDLHMEVVICHNDCWRENILFDQASGILTMIDYEVLDRNYAPFDLGVYLIACADNPPEIEKRPDEMFCKQFIRFYLSKRKQLQSASECDISADEVDKYYFLATQCMPLRAFYIAVILLYFYCETKDAHLWNVTVGFYKFYVDARKLYIKTAVKSQ